MFEKYEEKTLFCSQKHPYLWILEYRLADAAVETRVLLSIRLHSKSVCASKDFEPILIEHITTTAYQAHGWSLHLIRPFCT